MQASLSMASVYHTPVDYWLSVPLLELQEWADVAREMSEEKRNG